MYKALLFCGELKVDLCAKQFTSNGLQKTMNAIPAIQQQSESPTAVPAMDEEELQLLYTWVDDIPLSRPKKNIARDFSDGVLMAEIVKHFFPKLVQLHNYSTASSFTQKMYNWNTLNRLYF